MKVEKKTYLAEGIEEPCFEITSDDGFVLVRIATCYHYIGRNTLYVSEYIDGEFNGCEEIDGDFNALSFANAQRIAKQNSVYLS